MHGRCGWLYLGAGEPVFVKDWVYDVSRGALDVRPPVTLTETVPFRLYPAATIPEVPPLPGDPHFWGTIGPGGSVSGVARHPSQVNPAIGRCPWDPAEPRELLGRLVRQVWVEWAREQPEPKPSWLLPWEELDDAQREADMRIGAALYEKGYQAGWEANAWGEVRL